MEYQRPRVSLIGPALSAVQMHTGKQFTGNPDGAIVQPKYTLPAYDADE